MLDSNKLRMMVSHRVTFDFQSGARIVGYLASCMPAEGMVQIAVLSRAQILDGQGQLLGQYVELPLVPSLVVGFRITEGPGWI